MKEFAPELFGSLSLIAAACALGNIAVTEAKVVELRIETPVAYIREDESVLASSADSGESFNKKRNTPKPPELHIRKDGQFRRNVARGDQVKHRYRADTRH